MKIKANNNKINLEELELRDDARRCDRWDADDDEMNKYKLRSNEFFKF